MHSASFGLSVVVANWVVTLLERNDDASAEVAGVAAGLTLLLGIVTRPARRTRLRPHRHAACELPRGRRRHRAPRARLERRRRGRRGGVVGLAAGIPFASSFTDAARVMPDAPGAAIGVVNMAAAVTILVGTPLVGLSFSLPGRRPARLRRRRRAAGRSAALAVGSRPEQPGLAGLVDWPPWRQPARRPTSSRSRSSRRSSPASSRRARSFARSRSRRSTRSAGRRCARRCGGSRRSGSSRSRRTAASACARSRARRSGRPFCSAPSSRASARRSPREKITEEELVELEEAEQRFSRLARALRAREPGEDRRSLTVEWMRANHGFHNVIYRIADLPYIEQAAKNARRTFSGPAIWAPGDETIDELYLLNERQHASIRAALAARSPEGARELAREHVLSSFHLLETILEQVGVSPVGWGEPAPRRGDSAPVRTQRR